MTTNDPRQLQGHFAFGQNWQSFVSSVTEDNIAEASHSLTKLFPKNEIEGRRFLDIGCGSGLSMAAALRCGARSVHGIDLDPNSVAAAQTLLSRYGASGRWDARVASVFDLAPERDGSFDIVYSWGVLHHTGDMKLALRKAAALVAPGGQLAVALYRKTPLCGFWRREKRFYSSAGKSTQTVIRLIYQAVYCAGLLATGRNPIRYAQGYKSARGMSWSHDIHDWLGGYPYESIEPGEAIRLLEDLGFCLRIVRARPAALAGLFGSHCDEFVAIRTG